MRRLFSAAASVAILLTLFAPAAFAAEPIAVSGSVVVAADGTVDVPAGQDLDLLVVVAGTASIAGTVDTVVITGGSATLTGATVETLVVVDGSADLAAGTVVTGDVRTLQGTVTQQPGAVIEGTVKTLDGDLAAIALFSIPVLIVLFLGFGLLTIAAALLVAGFAARQVRGVESLITHRPGQVLVAGIAGSVVLPTLAILLMLTVVGAPIGFTMLFVLLPALAVLAWIVAAIWIGDRLVARMRGSQEPDRPYLAAVLGVLVLSLAGLIPFVTTIATLFGFGGLLLAAWRVLRPETPTVGEPGPALPAASPG
jgi:hypothetical protein